MIQCGYVSLQQMLKLLNMPQGVKIENINAVPISKFKNKMLKNFKNSKKVSNKLMKKLRLKLRYPNYKID